VPDFPERRSLLVTGAAGGIGAAVANAAVRSGFRVGAFDVDFARSEGVLDPTVERLVGSVADSGAVHRVFDTFGLPDVVVNNAGIVRFGPLVDLDPGDWRAVLDVNLTGTFLVATEAARRWIAAGLSGAVVNITSMNGVAAGPNAGAYGASKAGIALLTSQMALEWGRHGIRVNAVAPGLIDAGMSEPIYADDDIRAARMSKVPLGRLGTADDIAEVVLFLASPAAAYVTGQNIVVDGGVTGSVIAHLPRPAAVDKVGARP
jgi:NAD(P)-dependent dehydrogenase (short-subunit alcohol dehydrogenase family)